MIRSDPVRGRVFVAPGCKPGVIMFTKRRGACRIPDCTGRMFANHRFTYCVRDYTGRMFANTYYTSYP
jgi:hypothetical protein